MKGYWIARVDVHDPEGYKAIEHQRRRLRQVRGALHRPGRALRDRTREGRASATSSSSSRPTRRRSNACTRRNTRRPPSTATRRAIVDVIVISGYEGPQPGDA